MSNKVANGDIFTRQTSHSLESLSHSHPGLDSKVNGIYTNGAVPSEELNTVLTSVDRHAFDQSLMRIDSAPDDLSVDHVFPSSYGKHHVEGRVYNDICVTSSNIYPVLSFLLFFLSVLDGWADDGQTNTLLCVKSLKGRQTLFFPRDKYHLKRRMEKELMEKPRPKSLRGLQRRKLPLP